MKLFIFILIFLITKIAIAHGPVIIGHDKWMEVSPEEINVSVYDPILNTMDPIGFKGHGNVGAGVDGELLLWDNDQFCALVAYVRVYDFAWAFDASEFLGGKLKKLIHDIQDEMPTQILDKYCSLYSPENEDRKFHSNLIEIISKKKGVKGNKEIVRYQQFIFDNKLKCLFYSGGLVPFVVGYYKGGITGWLCVKDEDYFNKNKIRSITKSVGVYNFADPPQSLRLDINK